MYKKQNQQLSILDFGMPLGMSLDPNNRWVVRAQHVPWDVLEEKYSEQFKDSTTGNVAKLFRLMFGASLIKTIRQISDEETALQIQETPCLQYFCGLPRYEETLPFDPSSMTRFRKRLTPEILSELNEILITVFHDEADMNDGSDDQNSNSEITPEALNLDPHTDSKETQETQETPSEATPTNSGTLILDSTCVPQNIRYPQDLSLLDEARRNLEGMIDTLHDANDSKKPRTYRIKARKQYLAIAKKRHKSLRAVRKAQGQQLRYIKRNLSYINSYLLQGRELTIKQYERLKTIMTLYEQQLEMYKKNVKHVANRIVSLAQPYIRPIVRGKARAKTEFGAKIDMSVSNGLVRLEHMSFNAYNESENMINAIEKYYEREGHYPAKVLADQIYRTKANLKYCSEKNITMLGLPLGRPRKDSIPDKKQMRQDEIDRIEVEQKIALAKGSYGLGLIRMKLRNTSLVAISVAIFAMNLDFIVRFFCFLYILLLKTIKIENNSNMIIFRHLCRLENCRYSGCINYASHLSHIS